MKFALILATILVASVTADDGECPMKKIMMESYQACVDKLKSPEAAQENVKNNTGEDDKPTNDLRGCTMEGSGIMIDGKVDEEKLETMMRSNKDADPAQIDGVLAMFKACKEKCETSSDSSEVAGKYTKCFNEIAKEAEKS